MNFLLRIRNLLLFPSLEWKLIAYESRSFKKDVKFVYKLLLLGAISLFLGSYFYISYIDIDAYRLFYPLIQVVFYFIINYVTLILITFIISGISGKFGDKAKFLNTFTLIAYSFTPVFLLQIVSNLYFGLNWVLLLSVYALFLFAKGTSILIKTSKEKIPALTFIFLITASSIMYLVYSLFGVISAKIFIGLN